MARGSKLGRAILRWQTRLDTAKRQLEALGERANSPYLMKAKVLRLRVANAEEWLRFHKQGYCGRGW